MDKAWKWLHADAITTMEQPFIKFHQAEVPEAHYLAQQAVQTCA